METQYAKEQNSCESHDNILTMNNWYSTDQVSIMYKFYWEGTMYSYSDSKSSNEMLDPDSSSISFLA